MCERWVGDGIDCNILTPSSSDYSITSFSFCWAAQPCITEGRKPFAGSWFSLPRTATRTPNNWLQLTETVCGTGLYNCLSSTCFLWRCNCTEFNPSTVKVIPWYLRPDAPVIYTGASLNWQLGRGPICNTEMNKNFFKRCYRASCICFNFRENYICIYI